MSEHERQYDEIYGGDGWELPFTGIFIRVEICRAVESGHIDAEGLLDIVQGAIDGSVIVDDCNGDTSDILDAVYEEWEVRP